MIGSGDFILGIPPFTASPSTTEIWSFSDFKYTTLGTDVGHPYVITNPGNLGVVDISVNTNDINDVARNSISMRASLQTGESMDFAIVGMSLFAIIPSNPVLSHIYHVSDPEKTISIP